MIGGGWGWGQPQWDDMDRRASQLNMLGQIIRDKLRVGDDRRGPVNPPLNVGQLAAGPASVPIVGAGVILLSRLTIHLNLNAP